MADPRERYQARAFARRLKELRDGQSALARGRQVEFSTMPVEMDDGAGGVVEVDVPIDAGFRQGIEGNAKAEQALEEIANLPPGGGSTVVPSMREPGVDDDYPLGTVWWQLNEADEIVGQWQRIDQGNGPEWVRQQIASDQIAATLYGKRIIGAEIEGTTSVSGGYLNVTGGAPGGSDSTEYGLGIRQHGEPGTWRNLKRLGDYTFIGPEVTGTPDILGSYSRLVDQRVLEDMPTQRVIFSYGLSERAPGTGNSLPRDQHLAALGHKLSALIFGNLGLEVDRVNWGAQSIGARDLYAEHARMVHLTVREGSVTLPTGSVALAALAAGRLGQDRMPQYPSASATRGSNGSLVSSTAWQPLPLTALTGSSDSSVCAVNSSNGNVTMQRAGKFRLVGGANFVIPSGYGSYRAAAIFVNGVQVEESTADVARGAVSDQYVGQTLPVDVRLSVGDVVTLRTASNAGQGTVTLSGSRLFLNISQVGV